MNKLILVGNGFDLAHGLPTSYTHFLNNFWKTLHLNIKEDYIKEIIENDGSYFGFLNYGGNTINSFDDLIDNLESYCKDNGYQFSKEIVYAYQNFKIIFKFKNEFFKKINQKKSLQNWVDIENEYYSELKSIAKIENITISKAKRLNKEEIELHKKEKVTLLNKEFKQVKSLLKNYLINEVNKVYDFNSLETPKESYKLFEIFELNNFFQNHSNFEQKIKTYSKEFSFSEDKNQILKISKNLKNHPDEKIIFNTLFLDFNYTSTVYFYQNSLNNKMIMDYDMNKIHGDLNDIVFGFGDEIDEDYKLIENLDDNEYLENFKSFKYFQNDKYNKLLQYIDTDKFQVYVLGHSCGLSDRVMLNTIFEHENCRSIKVYYHKKENGTDNYLDIVQNISRHFKDKPLMRRKIVNKEFSSPLPQNVRFKRK